MVEIAQKDGYQLEFVALGGSDHYEDVLKSQRLTSTGASMSGDSITSDITRPSILHIAAPEGLANYPPVTLPGCTAWRMILPVKGHMEMGECIISGVTCVVCRKLKAITPESYFYNVGFLADVLARCHESSGVTWTCQRATDGTITYLPSGRQYPDDPRRATISSSKIRQTLSTGLIKRSLQKRLNGMAMNTDLLPTLVGVNEEYEIAWQMKWRERGTIVRFEERRMKRQKKQSHGLG
jgi:hypothetical protein